MRSVAGAVFLALSMAQPAEVRAQGSSPIPAPNASPRERTLKIARAIMAAARFCTMVTTIDGEAQARIVDPLEPDAAFVVHLATNPLSRKVSQMRANPRITLLYFDTSRLAYVTLIGMASPVPENEKTALYKKDWEGFFDRSRSASYALYRVVPSRVEVVSAGDGLTGDPATWRPEIIHFK